MSLSRDVSVRPDRDLAAGRTDDEMLWLAANDLPSLEHLARFAANHAAVRKAKHQSAVLLDICCFYDRANDAENWPDARRFVRADKVDRALAIGERVNANVRIQGGFRLVAGVEHETEVARPEVADLLYGSENKRINCAHAQIVVRFGRHSRTLAQPRAAKPLQKMAAIPQGPHGLSLRRGHPQNTVQELLRVYSGTLAQVSAYHQHRWRNKRV